MEPQRIGLWVKLDHIGEMLEDGIPVSTYTPNLTAATNYTDYFARLVDEQGGYINVPLLPRYAEGIEEVTDMGLFVPRANNGTTALEFEAEVARVAELTARATGWVYLEGEVPLPGAVRIDSLYVRTYEQDRAHLQRRISSMGAPLAAHVGRSHADRRGGDAVRTHTC